MKQLIESLVKESIEAKKQLLAEEQVGTIEQIARKMIAALAVGKKVLAFGNGGSAADAQHLVAELVCRFQINRKALPAIALNSNVANLTSIGNDLGFDQVFSRQVEALVQHGDIVIGFSTSGKSPNVIKAIETAKKAGAYTIGFSGERGILKDTADICLAVPSSVTGRVQECHILAVHIVCQLVEEHLFAKK
jgi:D-sedoheptulose 7-phosphate isomerase